MPTRFRSKLPAVGKAATAPIRSSSGSIRGTGAWTSKPKTGGSLDACPLSWQSEERQGRHPERSCTNAMKRISGLKLLEEREGVGTPAKKGDRVMFNMKLFLNKGEEIPLNETQAKHLPKEMIRVVEGIISSIARSCWDAMRPSP